MYNTKPMEAFLESVKKEAEEAAQAVFNKHQDEFITRIKNQMHKDHKLFSGMGSVHIENKEGYEVGEKFSSLLQEVVYYYEPSVGFDLNDLGK